MKTSPYGKNKGRLALHGSVDCIDYGLPLRSWKVAQTLLADVSDAKPFRGVEASSEPWVWATAANGTPLPLGHRYYCSGQACFQGRDWAREGHNNTRWDNRRRRGTRLSSKRRGVGRPK